MARQRWLHAYVNAADADIRVRIEAARGACAAVAKTTLGAWASREAALAADILHEASVDAFVYYVIVEEAWKQSDIINLHW